MKIIAVIAFTLYLFLKSYSFIPCNTDTAKQAIPPVLFFEQKIDGPNQPPLITRFFHSKATIGASQVAKCYFNKIDPVYLYESMGIFGLFFWLVFIYKAMEDKNLLLVAVFLALPFVDILKISPIVFIVGSKIFAIYGLCMFLGVRIKIPPLRMIVGR